MMEAICSFETSDTLRTLRYYSAEDCVLQRKQNTVCSVESHKEGWRAAFGPRQPVCVSFIYVMEINNAEEH
jgi:hypothetical protein